jgi:hypothetical protein|tara:strand:+ start:57 stop:263 length:207 start_codon:yes stop_codon:yes gene_type:complete
MVYKEGYYEFMGRRLREEGVFESARGRLYEMDMAELTGAYYNILKRNKELIEENEKLKEENANLHNQR